MERGEWEGEDVQGMERGENEISEGRQRKISTWFCALGYYNNVFTSENSSSSKSVG